MNIHRLRVVDYDTPVRKLEGTSTIIEHDEDSGTSEKDQTTARVILDSKPNTTSEENGGGDQNATADSVTCPTGSKKLCLLKRRSKSELFRLPSQPKSKKYAPKNVASSEDLKKSYKPNDRSNHRSRYNLVFNRDSILNLHSKGGDVKTNIKYSKKKEEPMVIPDKETPKLMAKVKTQGREKNNMFKVPKDAFGFQKSNRHFDPCLYQMSCHFLDLDNHSAFNMLRKRFRYKHSRKKQKQQPDQSKDVERKYIHHKFRVLNSQEFKRTEENPDKYYNVTNNESPRETQPIRKIYKDTWRRNYTNLNLKKDANVFVSSSVLVPRKKYCVERACGCSRQDIVTESPSCSQNKNPSILKCESETSERRKLIAGIVNSITSCKAVLPTKNTTKISMKNICLGLLIIVWSPCLLAVILALIIISPWRVTNFLGNDTSKTACPKSSVLDKFKPKCLLHECQRICSSYTRTQQKSVLSSVAGWFTRAADTAAASLQATLSLVKLNKNRHPTCAGSAFVPKLPKATCKYPNPKVRYNLYYAHDRGWVMKPTHQHRQYQNMRCEYSPKMQPTSRRSKKSRKSDDICCKDMILEVKHSKPSDCSCAEMLAKNKADECRCTAPDQPTFPCSSKPQQVNITSRQNSPIVDPKIKSDALCSCMHNQVLTNKNTVELDQTACIPLSPIPHYCVGMLYGITTNYNCGIHTHGIGQHNIQPIHKANNLQTKVQTERTSCNVKKHQSTSVEDISYSPKASKKRTQLAQKQQSRRTQTAHAPKKGQATRSYPSQHARGLLNHQGLRLVDVDFPLKTNSYQQTSLPRTPYTSKIDLFRVFQSQSSKYFRPNKIRSSSPDDTTRRLFNKAISYTPVLTGKPTMNNNEKILRTKSVRYKSIVDKCHTEVPSIKSQFFKTGSKWACAIEKLTDRESSSKSIKEVEAPHKQSMNYEKSCKFIQTNKSAFMVQSQGTMFPSRTILQSVKIKESRKPSRFMSLLSGKRDQKQLELIAKLANCPCDFENPTELPSCKKIVSCSCKKHQTKSSMPKLLPFIKAIALSYKHVLKGTHQRKGSTRGSSPCPCETNRETVCPPSPSNFYHPPSPETEQLDNVAESLENIKCPCDIAVSVPRKCFSIDNRQDLKSRTSQLLQKGSEITHKSIKITTSPSLDESVNDPDESKSTTSMENIPHKRLTETKKTITSASLEKMNESQNKVKSTSKSLNKVSTRHTESKKTHTSSLEKVTDTQTKATSTSLSLQQVSKRLTKMIKSASTSINETTESQTKTVCTQKPTESQAKTIITKKPTESQTKAISERFSETKSTEKIPKSSHQSKDQSTLLNESDLAKNESLEKDSPPITEPRKSCFTNSNAKVTETSPGKVECACKIASLRIAKDILATPCPCMLIRKPGKTCLPGNDTNTAENTSEKTKTKSDQACPCVLAKECPIPDQLDGKAEITKISPSTKTKTESPSNRYLRSDQIDGKTERKVSAKKMSDKACPCVLSNQCPQSRQTAEMTGTSPTLKNAVTCECKEGETQTSLTKNKSKSRETKSQKRSDCVCKTGATQTIICKKKLEKPCPCRLINDNSILPTCKSCQVEDLKSALENKIAVYGPIKKKSDKACPCELAKQFAMLPSCKSCQVEEGQSVLPKKMSATGLTNKMSASCFTKPMSDKACDALCKTNAKGTSPVQEQYSESASHQSKTSPSLEKPIKGSPVDSKTKDTTASLEKPDTYYKTECVQVDLPKRSLDEASCFHKRFSKNVVSSKQTNQLSKASQVSPQKSSKQYSRINQNTPKSQSPKKLVTSCGRRKQSSQNRSTSISSMNTRRTKPIRKSPSKLPQNSPPQISPTPHSRIKQSSQNRYKTSMNVRHTKSPEKQYSQQPHQRTLLSPQDQSTPKASKTLLKYISPKGSISYKQSIVLQTSSTKISSQGSSNLSYNRLKNASKCNMNHRNPVRLTKEEFVSHQHVPTQRLIISHDHTTQSEFEQQFVPRGISRRYQNKLITTIPQNSISDCLCSNDELHEQTILSAQLLSESIFSRRLSNVTSHNSIEQAQRPYNIKSKLSRYGVRAVTSQTYIKSKSKIRYSNFSKAKQASFSSQFTSHKIPNFSKTKLEKKHSPIHSRPKKRSLKVTGPCVNISNEPSCSTIYNQTSSEESKYSQAIPLLNNFPNAPIIATFGAKKSGWFSKKPSQYLQKPILENQLGFSKSHISQLVKTSVHSKSTQIHITPRPTKIDKCTDLPQTQNMMRLTNKCNQTSKHLFFVTDNISKKKSGPTRRLHSQLPCTHKTILKDSPQQILSRHSPSNQVVRPCCDQGTGMSGLRISVHSKQTPTESYHKPLLENKSVENRLEIIQGQQSGPQRQIEPIVTAHIPQNRLQFPPFYISPYSNMFAMPCHGGCLEIPQQIKSLPHEFGCPLAKQNDSGLPHGFGCPLGKQNVPGLPQGFGCPLGKQNVPGLPQGFGCPLANDPCFGPIYKMQQTSQTSDGNKRISPNVEGPFSPNKQNSKEVACECYDTKPLKKPPSENTHVQTETIRCSSDKNGPLSKDASSKVKCLCSTQTQTSELIKCLCDDKNSPYIHQSEKRADSLQKVQCKCFNEKPSLIECSSKKSYTQIPYTPGPGAPLVYRKPVVAPKPQKSKIEVLPAKDAHVTAKKKKTTFHQADLERSIERQRRKMILKQKKIKENIEEKRKKSKTELTCWQQIKEGIKESEEQAWPLERSHFQAKILQHPPDENKENICCISPVDYKSPTCPAPKQVPCLATTTPAAGAIPRDQTPDEDIPLRYRKPKLHIPKLNKPKIIPKEKTSKASDSQTTESTITETTPTKGIEESSINKHTETHVESPKEKAKREKAEAKELMKTSKAAAKEQSKIEKKHKMETLKLHKKAETQKLKEELKHKKRVAAEKLKDEKRQSKLKQKELGKKQKMDLKKKKEAQKLKIATEKKKQKLMAKQKKKQDKLKEKREMKAEKEKLKEKLKKEKQLEKQKRKEEARLQKIKRKKKWKKERDHRGLGPVGQCIAEIVQFDKDVFPVRVTCRPMYIHTLRKRPCLWIYRMCPWLYPCFLQCLQCHRDCCRMFCYGLSILIWAPIVYCCTCCFEMLVCAC